MTPDERTIHTANTFHEETQMNEPYSNYPAPGTAEYDRLIASHAKPKKRRKWPIALAVLAGLGIIGVAMSSAAEDANNQPPSPERVFPDASTEAPVPIPTPAASNPLTDDGTWVVGQDIQPGTYLVEPDNGIGGYWARCSAITCSMQGDGGGILGDILENGVVQGPSYLTIQPGDVAVQTRGIALTPMG